MKRIVIVLFLLMLGAACNAKHEASVECMRNMAGYGCTVTHKTGDKKIHVCWNLSFTCRNGATAEASHCADVEPKGKVSALVPYTKFGAGAANCDMPVAESVTNLKVSLP